MRGREGRKEGVKEERKERLKQESKKKKKWTRKRTERTKYEKSKNHVPWSQINLFQNGPDRFLESNVGHGTQLTKPQFPYMYSGDYSTYLRLFYED